ncbi:MAG TPA: transposase [Thermoanaerobaculia bacterium]|nr:transposase [Thermoanaerobaculia bacterium]
MNARVDANPELMRRRKAIVEHPFGTIKRWMNQSYFLMRGLDNVRAEFSLSALAYNLKRVLAIVGVPALLEAIA